MKLKPLKPRLYNIMFHTHTVSGIVISFVLFVIFYAGAFSLFKDELYKWENPKARFELKENINYDSIINVALSYDKSFEELRKIRITIPTEENPFLNFFIASKTPEGENINITYFINPHTGEYLINPRKFDVPNKSLTYMGETLYRLHYFRQIIPPAGIYIAGLVAFFFLFAIITGVLIHWKNIFTKFYAFVTKGKWKQIWTNSHTTLGVIALPFQFLYAVTGALLGLSLVLIAPSAYLLYDGDRDEIVNLVRPDNAISYNEETPASNTIISINDLYANVKETNPDYEVSNIIINNFKKVDQSIFFNLDNHKSVSGQAQIFYLLEDNKLSYHEINLNTKTYTRTAYNMLIKLHYANYGGLFLKLIYFILAMITCYIIVSGILIWQKARDNDNYTDKQRRFHHRVTKSYLSLCLSMFPAFALIFIANKVIPLSLEGRVGWVQTIFFSSWMLLTVLGLLWNNYSSLNRNYLLIGSLIALLVPITNGFVTNDWFWKTCAQKQYYVFSVDVFWFMTGISGLLIYFNYLKKSKVASLLVNKN